MEYVHPIRDNRIVEAMKELLKEKNERDYILFLIGINTGFRVSDILKLTVKDVKNLDYIRRREIKTGKNRRAPINDELKRALKKYIKGKDDKEYLIKSRQRDKDGNQKAIDRSRAYVIIREAAIDCGFRDTVGTHTMRKTFAYRHYRKHNNLAALKKILNHDTEEYTMAYIGLEDDYLERTIMELND
ncbi:site-specific integrase [Salmonella enterica subsp. enterica]|jgi:integrase|nr:site-specific integrase [Salmonella enterica subsp. enterica serovar Paratyphi A]